MKNYFNTTNENNENVAIFVKINNKQDANVLANAKELTEQKGCFTSSEVYLQYLHKHILEGVLLTSVRRSVNTLFKAGLIVKTGERQEGRYKRSELVFKVV